MRKVKNKKNMRKRVIINLGIKLKNHTVNVGKISIKANIMTIMKNLMKVIMMNLVFTIWQMDHFMTLMDFILIKLATIS